MPQINSPRFPLFAWGPIVLSPDFVITVNVSTIGSKRVFLNPSLSLPSGEYGVDPYGVTSSSLAAALGEALTLLFRSTPNAGRCPDGVFSLFTTQFWDATYADGAGAKNFPVVSLEYPLTIALGVTITIDFDGQENNFGFATSPVLSSLVTTALGTYCPTQMWAPNSYNASDLRDYFSDVYSTVSTFTPSAWTTTRWSPKREKTTIKLPAVNAEFIFVYRRADPDFSQYTTVTNPNNLLEFMLDAAMDGKNFEVWWSSSYSETWAIQDPEQMVMSATLEDIASSRMYDVSLMMMRIQ